MSKSTKKTKYLRTKHVPKLKGETAANYFNRVVQTNQHLFERGKVITNNQMCVMFGLAKQPGSLLFEDVQKHNFQKLTAYTGLNKVLAFRGIAIKSVNYSSEFHVLDGLKTTSQVAQSIAISKSKRTYATNLKRGAANHKGDWSDLNKQEMKAAAQTFNHYVYK